LCVLCGGAYLSVQGATEKTEGQGNER
jgi:hypothetical protein